MSTFRHGTKGNSGGLGRNILPSSHAVKNNSGLGRSDSSQSVHQELALERKFLKKIRCELRALVILAIVANIAIHEIYFAKTILNDPRSTTTIAPASSIAIGKDKTSSNNNNNVIYGHVHIPKTGGSTLNGLMAAKYERVCGNKGYTFDAYQANIRAFREGTAQKDIHKGSGGAWSYQPNKIGYENCDYISNEIRADFWSNTSRALNVALEPSGSIAEQALKHDDERSGGKNTRRPKNNDDLVFELHVPCRDPIDHLLSMANHEGTIIKCVVFNCTGVETDDKLLEREVERAYFDMGRFGRNWPTTYRNNKDGIRIRCFQSIPVEAYIDYMDNFLQKRRIPSAYYPHETNDKRDKSKECVRNLPEGVKDKIRGILRKNHPYMKFCKTCMGTEQQLPL